jgi:N utilization substance protein A
VGDILQKETTPADFGRIAAQTAKQVVMQRIREAERDRVYSEFTDREGDIVLATVQRQDQNGNVIMEVGRAEAVMPPNHQVKSERYRTGNRMRVLLLEVQRNPKGPQLIVSRADRAFLRRLFELEVPEIFTGSVEIKGIAREGGMRSKVAVAARQANVDPVGSCVGMKGQRIQKIVDELGGEKVDVVPWDPDMRVYIANALAPAQVLSVDLDEEKKTASVVVPDRMLSLAIGKEGQNARLAAKLTGWRIDIRSAVSPGAEEEGMIDDEELTRRAVAALRAEASAGTENGFQSPVITEPAEATKDERRKVRPNTTVVYQNAAYGPLPEPLVGESVRLRPMEGQIQIRTDSGRVLATFDVQEPTGEDGEEE